MKRKRYYCHKCKKNLKSSVGAKQHFDEYPTHRTKEQKEKRRRNLIDGKAKRARDKAALPTVQVKRRRKAVKVETLMKFCTQCGQRRKPSHKCCGYCGERLTA